MTKRELRRFYKALDEYVDTVEWPDDDDNKILVLYWHPTGTDRKVRFVASSEAEGVFEIQEGPHEGGLADLDLILEEPLNFDHPPVYYELFEDEKEMMVFMLSAVDVGTQFAVYPRHDVVDIDWDVLR
jgi:hypothetical protein